jgi:hypothetical protein
MGTSTSRGHSHSHAQNRHAVLPTPVRLGVDGDYSARGVTIAFLDSGFYPHPDLTQPANRIVDYIDITKPGATLNPHRNPESWAWHGTLRYRTIAVPNRKSLRLVFGEPSQPRKLSWGT